MINIPSLHGNWVDLLIIIFLVLFLYDTWYVDFWVVLANFISFLLSIVIALKAYQIVAILLRNNFSLTYSLSNALGFLATAVISEGLISLIFGFIISKLHLKSWKQWWARLLTLIPALGEALIILSFFLTLFVGLPFAPKFKTDVTDSKIGGYLINNTSGIESKLNQVFGGIIQDTLNFLTIKTGSNESIPLNIGAQTLTIDKQSEEEMFKLVNGERTSRGIRALVWDPRIVPVAEAYAKDMWERKYFSHVSPEGKDVGDRLEAANIKFQIAGENLALAPTLATAHNGLMNSQGHRENILNPQFRKIGIGVVDNGIYGKIFVQVFTD